MNFRFPIFLDLAGKRCLVTGEGQEVASKLKALIDATAQAVYINPTAEPQIQEWEQLGLVAWRPKTFEPSDLEGCFLIITSGANNASVFALAESRGILCNAIDDPEHCRFSFGSVHRQGDLTIAVSTNGWAPAMAVRLRQWLEREIGPEYGALLSILKESRPRITEQIPDFARRRDLWYRIVDSDVLVKLREGRQSAASNQIKQLIEEAIQEANTPHPRN